MIASIFRAAVGAAVRAAPAALLDRLSVAILCRLVQYCDVGSADLLQARLDPVMLRLEDKIRRLRNPGRLVTSYAAPAASTPLAVSVMAPDRPWISSQFRRYDMPGMITDEEIRYYYWVSQYYSGEYAAVELGPWPKSFFVSLMV